MVLRVLNVAEKNDAAKEISRLMSGGRCTRREGYSVYNKIYEFDYNVLNQNARMIMTSLSGHMMNMEFTGQYKKWYGCSPVALFTAPVEKQVAETGLQIKRTLEKEARSCHILIVWTDCDREGENIGFEIIDVCRKVKPAIEIYRARFSEITPQSVSRACANLVLPDENVSQAVDVRQELDLRIGAAFTRFQTLRLKKIFPDVLSNQLISYGSCQFPTLGFVVERYKEIERFVPETFYKIKVLHTTEDGQVEFNWKRFRLFDEMACLVLYEICLENPLATVMSITSRPKSKWRPLPLDTVEFEKLCSRKLRINAKEAMKIAEKLYTQGYISYPRTETNIFPESLDLRPLIEEQTRDPNWGGFAANLLNDGPTPRQGTKTDHAHPPIHPTKYTNNLQGNEQRIYEFIVRHFLACCSKDARGQETTVEIDIAAERFTCKGLMIIARNYLEVYIYDKWADKVLPVFNQGDTFEPSSIEMINSETSPPSLLTEADLIALMEKHGIGTDATHAEHIETIKNRGYVGVHPQDNTFLPGELGMGLVDGYDSMGFAMSKPHLRSQLEADLKRICDGEKNKDVVLAEQIENYRTVFIAACEKAMKLDEALSQYFGPARQLSAAEIGIPTQQTPEEKVRRCPRCGKDDMTLRKCKDGKYMIGCMGYPQCKASIFFPKFVLEAAVDQSTCARCRPQPVHHLKLFFKRGSVPPAIPLEFIGCVGGCDEDMRQILGLKDLTVPPPAEPSRPMSTSNRVGTSNVFRGVDRGLANRGTRGRGTGASTRGRGNTNQRQNNGRGINSPSNTSGNFGSSSNRGDNLVACTCGQPAVSLTVRKEGPNTGRQFYACSNREGGCGFFLWADEDAGEGGGQVNRNGTGGSDRRYNGGGNNQYNGGGYNQGGQENVMCGCNQPAVSRTVSKEGPNKGRPFFCCCKPQGQGCNFFQWGDESGPPAPTFQRGAARGRSSAPRGGSNRGGLGNTGARATRKCSNCRQEGHTKKNCTANRFM